MLVKYDSNNSGGKWWLKDEDWENLEKAGWKVNWIKDEEKSYYARFAKDGRFLGALATGASKEAETPKEAMEEFERITGQRVSDEGCNCCGPPHCFSWGEDKNYGCVSGENCLGILFPNSESKSLREFYEDSSSN